MQLIRTKYYPRMGSGNKWGACGSNGGRTTTAWGKTEQEAQDKLESKFNEKKK